MTNLNDKKIIAYYTSWCQYPPRLYPITELPIELLTHVNYAFANIVEGRIAVGDQWGDVDKPFNVPADNAGLNSTLLGNYQMLNHPNSPLRIRNCKFRSLISVGGWTWSKDFSLVARDAEARTVFVDSCIEFLVRHGFDGIDLDWEYPVVEGLAGNHTHPDDGRNFHLLLSALRNALQNASQLQNRAEPFLLTVATSATESTYQHLDMPGLVSTCDWINVMTYDGAGPWSSSTAHHSCISLAHKAINGYIHRGVPSHKLLLGIPFYARSFANVDVSHAHTFTENRAFSGAGPGTHEPGVMEFDHIITSCPSYQSHFVENELVVAWFDAQSKMWMSGENDVSVHRKGAWAQRMHLGGCFFWESSMDRNAVLVRALHSGLHEQC